jgi:hypothetical protein
MKSISAREIFKSFGHEWMITRIRIHSNYRNDDRIEVSARRRYYKGDEVNTYNEILSYKYADRLARDFYGKSILKFNNIDYEHRNSWDPGTRNFDQDSMKKYNYKTKLAT